MRRILLLAVVVTFILASAACMKQALNTPPGTDISGKWTLTMWGAGAEESVPVVFKADGEKLTVTCSHPAFKEMTGTGTLKGDDISFDLNSSAMEIAFTGKVAGNKMEGVREIKGASQGGMPAGTGDTPDGAPGGAPGGQGPASGGLGDAAPQGGMPAGAGGQGAPQGMPDQGGAQAQSSENWTAVKN